MDHHVKRITSFVIAAIEALILVPLIVGLVFRPGADARVAWALLSRPESVGETVRGALHDIYGEIPGSAVLAHLALGQTRAERVAVKRLPTRTATAKADTSPYVLTVTTDRAAYAPGETVAVAIRVRGGAPGWKPVVPAPGQYPAITITGPGGVPVPGASVSALTGPAHACPESRMSGCLTPSTEQRAVGYVRAADAGDYVVSVSVGGPGMPPATAQVRVHVAAPAAAGTAAEPTISGSVRIGSILLRAGAPASVPRGSPVDVAVSATNEGRAVWCPGSWYPGVLMVRVVSPSGAAASPYAIHGLGTWQGLDVMGSAPGEQCLSPGHTATAVGTWTARSSAADEPPVPPGRYVIEVGRGLGGFGLAVGVREQKTRLVVTIK